MNLLATMDLSQAQAWVIIISALGTLIMGIISALKSKQNGAKLDVIHTLTNSNLTAVKADLEIARKDISFLKEFISKNTTPPDPTAESLEFIAKVELASERPGDHKAASSTPPKTP